MKPTRGGARPGAGRKPIPPGDKMIARQITMTQRDWDYVKTVGDGNRSLGVRMCIEEKLGMD